MEYLKGDKRHPKNIACEVRPERYYRPPEWTEGAYPPGSVVMVAQAELDIAEPILVRVGSPEHKAMHGESGAARVNTRDEKPSQRDDIVSGRGVRGT